MLWTLLETNDGVNLSLNGEISTVKDIRGGTFMKEIEILLDDMQVLTVSLKDYRAEGNHEKTSTRTKFVSLWKKHFVPNIEWPTLKMPLNEDRSNSSSSSDFSDEDLSNLINERNEEYSSDLNDKQVVGSQDILLKEQYRGTYPVHIRNLVAPVKEHRMRLLDQEHVNNLVRSFRENSLGQVVVLLGLVEHSVDLNQLRIPGYSKVECLGGKHTRQALLTLMEEGLLPFETVHVRLYSNLTQELALSLGYAHNMITHDQRKVVTFMDKVRLMHDIFPEDTSKESINFWKKSLALIFKKKDVRQLQRQFQHHLLIARFPQNAWDTLVRGVTVHNVKVTERFFIPLTRLKDDLIERALICLEANGVQGYRKEMMSLLSDEKNLKQKIKLRTVGQNLSAELKNNVQDTDQDNSDASVLITEENKEINSLKKDLRAAEVKLAEKETIIECLREEIQQLKRQRISEDEIAFKIGDKVWAKYSDGIKYPAIITDHNEITQKYTVKYEEDNKIRKLFKKDLMKLDDTDE